MTETMTTLSLQLQIEDELARDLQRLSGSSDQTQEELVGAALRHFISLIKRYHEVRITPEEFRALQQKMAPYAQNSGYQSEQEYFDSL